MAEDLSVVIPAYQESGRLPRTLRLLISGIPEVFAGSWQIVVSDDGSTDGTDEVARAFAANAPVTVVRSERNRGKGAAVLAGAVAAHGPLVFVVDADLPVPLETLTDMVQLASEADLVLGSRRLPGSEFVRPQPAIRRAGGHVFRGCASVMGYRASSDPQCGVKLLRKDRMEPVLDQLECRGFGFDIELIERSRRQGLRVVETPVSWFHVDGSSLHPVRDATSTLWELIRLRRRLDTPGLQEAAQS